LEYKIKAWLAAREPPAEGYFLSSKTYCLVTNDNTIIIKAKGIQNDSLTLDDFKNMLNNKEDITANKNYSNINYSRGARRFSKFSFKRYSIRSWFIQKERKNP